MSDEFVQHTAELSLNDKFSNAVNALESDMPEADVNELLYSVLSDSRGIDMMAEYLWLDLELNENTLIVKGASENSVEKIWNKKDKIIKALSLTCSDAAFKAIAPFMLVWNADDAFNNKVIITAERALVNIKGKNTKDELLALDGFEIEKIHPQTLKEIDETVSAFAYGMLKREELKNHAVISCPHCNREIELDSLFCKHCGYNLTEERAQEQDTPPYLNNENKMPDNVTEEEKKKFRVLYFWTFANFLVGCVICSAASFMMLSRMAVEQSVEKRNSYSSKITIVNIISNVIGVMWILWLLTGR